MGTYTHRAAVKLASRYGIDAPLEPWRTIPDAINAANEAVGDMAVVAIENSTEGPVNAAIDTIAECEKLGIIAETILPIRHCLLSRGTDIAAIERVASHPQALAQCRKFIASHLKGAIVVESPSTAGAAQNLAGEREACVASQDAADKYGLNILAECINDVKSNQTRFALVGDRNVTVARVGNNAQIPSASTMICVVLKNVTGALNRLTSILAAADINMTSIIPRPIAENPGEYKFYV